MNEKLIEELIRQFAQEGASPYRKEFRIQGRPGVYKLSVVHELTKGTTLTSEGRTIFDDAGGTTISAMPKGQPCPRCQGSGSI